MACLLVGLQGLPLVRCSSVYIALYSLVKDHLGKAVLNTPGEASTIQTLLIFSVWNLTPSYRDHYIDSWLVSGLAVQHSALAFNSNSHANNVPHKNKSRLWTIAYLQNLKYV